MLRISIPQIFNSYLFYSQEIWQNWISTFFILNFTFNYIIYYIPLSILLFPRIENYILEYTTISNIILQIRSSTLKKKHTWNSMFQFVLDRNFNLIFLSNLCQRTDKEEMVEKRRE